jgi:hypothetical protein
MTKTEQSLKITEDFIRNVLAKNFDQRVDADDLRAAAVRLCKALPEPVCVPVRRW